jgi:hypothetical protein
LLNTRIIRAMKLKKIRLVEHMARRGKNENACGIVLGKPTGRRPLGRPTRRLEDNIKTDFKEVR